MRKLTILKTCLDLFFFFGIFSFASAMVLVMIAIFGEGELDLTVNGLKIVSGTWMAKSLLFCWLVSTGFFVKAIQLLRRNVHSFVKLQIFTNEVIATFNRIGIYILFSTFGLGIPSLIYSIVDHESITMELEVGNFDTGVLSVALGLFFMVLSEVFKLAKNLKDENDLTL